MLAYVFAVLAAAVNAASSVLQRKAHRDHPVSGTLTITILHVLRNPVWLLGFAAIGAGFLLQAAALSQGALSVVEPVLIIELPLTLVAAAIAFRRKLCAREWAAALTMTVATAGVLWALSPDPHSGEHVAPSGWILGIPVNVAVIVAIVLVALKFGPERRAFLLGIACGTTYGLAVTFMKTVTTHVSDNGLVGALTAWQTYGMIVTGLAAVYLEQAAFNAGSLLAAQPGLTILDPVVSTLWGMLGYGETIRTGGYLAGAIVAAVVVVIAVVSLGTSPLLTAVSGGGESAGRSGSDRQRERTSDRAAVTTASG